MSRNVLSLESVCDEREVGERLYAIRMELYGEDGVLKLAQQLGISPKAWRRYEAGKLMPVDILLGFVECTDTRLDWLMTGIGPKYSSAGGSSDSSATQPGFEEVHPLERPRLRVVAATSSAQESAPQSSAEIEAAKAEMLVLKEQLDTVQGQSARSQDEVRYLRGLCDKMKTRSAAVRAARDEVEMLRRQLAAQRAEIQRLRAELERKQEAEVEAARRDPRSAFRQHLQQLYERELKASDRPRSPSPLAGTWHRD